MAMILTDSSNYSAIAEAIREKTGTEDTYKPSEMAAAIEAIQGGGEDNTFLEGGITEYSNSIITKIRDYGFYNYSTLESVSLPNVTTVGKGCFHSCKALTNVNLPS